MNIFATHPDPYICSLWLDDKRLNKMILETAQLLATAVRFHGGTATYKSTHINHPCSKWVRETRSNYEWLLLYFIKLNNEYHRRFIKYHKCKNYRYEFTDGLECIPKGNLTEFANCTQYKDLPIHDAYKKCLHDKWINDKRIPKWTNDCLVEINIKE